MADPTFTIIDTDQKFPHLANAPIVEAIIQIRTRSAAVWEESQISNKLKSELRNYPKTVPQRQLQRAGDLQDMTARNAGWKGLRLESADEKQLAVFTKDGFLFSRLKPYECWSKFKIEALRLWQIHQQLGPAEVDQVAIRFINRIQMPPGAVEFEEFLQPHPQTPHGLAARILDFFHQESLVVPLHPYNINIVRATQPPQVSQNPPWQPSIALILDINVFRNIGQPFAVEALDRYLEEMRWLKNKVFFGSVTKTALAMFGEGG